MSNSFRKLTVGAGVLLLLLALQVPAKADSTYNYTFTGSGILSGTNFTYESTTGTLSFSTGDLAPTTAGDLVMFGYDTGAITSFDFISSSSYTISSSSGEISLSSSRMNYNLSTLGNQVLWYGTLTITDPPTSMPEPSTFFLLVTGLAAAVLFSCDKRLFPSLRDGG
jgi:hypothetical protein